MRIRMLKYRRKIQQKTRNNNNNSNNNSSNSNNKSSNNSNKQKKTQITFIAIQSHTQHQLSLKMARREKSSRNNSQNQTELPTLKKQ